MNGGATTPDFGTVAYAGAQLKNALDATIRLGGAAAGRNSAKL